MKFFAKSPSLVIAGFLFALSCVFAHATPVAAGSTVAFSVTADGTSPFTYQWKKNGANVAGATNSTLTITNVQSTDAGSYSVTVANSAGSTDSDISTITVTAGNVAPAITTQPVSQSVATGANVTFSAAASGVPTPTYQWKKDGVDVAGATSATLTLSAVATTAAGTYTVVATNSAGSATSSGAVLTVTTTSVAPAITTQPVSQTVTAGVNVTFTAAASGTPTPTYQWKKGGVNISGATSATLTLTAVTASSAGTYTVVATNSAGSATSTGAVLTVNVAPAITTQPASQSVAVGANVTFTAAASGTPTPTYQWKKGGVNISGATSASLTLTAVTSGSAGTYTVVATNSLGSATSTGAVLTVTTNVAPAITTQPASQSVTAGANVTFTAAASGAPTPTFQWKKDGVNITGATSATLTLSSVQTTSAGTYTVVATNSVGSATSSGAVLTVSTPTVAPAITTQPQGQSVTVGANVALTVAASGAPSPTFQWKKDGVNISGATSTTLNLLNVTTSSAGTYTVVATNSVGSATSSGAVLTVSAVTTPPTFTTQPLSQTVNAGVGATFTVAVSGAPAPTVQWRKDGVAITGATSTTLSISNAQVTSAGTYTVVATNSAGSATSAGAVLTVVSGPAAAPVMTTDPLSQAAFVGSSVSLVAAASGSPTPTYQWQKDGIDVAGATSATLILTNVQLTDAGTYAVVARNASGSVTSIGARVVVLVTQPNAISYGATVVPKGVTAGGTVSFYYLLTNIGTKAWGASHYLSIRDSSNNFVAFTSLIGVAPGESKAVNLRFAAPTTPGTYTYTIQALEDGVELFSTQATVTLTVLASTPNAATYNDTNFPVSAAPGSTVIFHYTVTNSGSNNWGANHFLSLRDSNNVFSAFSPLAGVAAGQGKTVNLSFTAPTVPGVYQYYVQALESGVEFFDTQANLTLVVLAPQSNAAVYTATRAPDNVTPGATVNLRYALSNSGMGSWGPNHYASLRDGNGNYLAFVPLNGVAPAGSATANFSFTAPTTPGTYTYYVQALENGVEFFSTQDMVTLTVLATPIGNALTFNSTNFPETVMRGATVNLNFNVTNRGTKAWGVNHFLSLRDADNTFLQFLPLLGTAPGASKTVSMSIVAPTTPGIYTYRLQGLEAGIEFFNMTDNLVLIVQ